MANNQKTALVTGSSRGIGAAIAKRLAKDGYKVYINCVGSMAKAEEVRDAIVANGGNAEIVQADLSDIDAVKQLPERVGPIDALILNASIQIRQKWSEITTEEAYTQLNCNLVASLHLIQAFAPHMQAQKWGRIVTIGSVQEAKPHPDMLIYSASKAAQTNMVRSLSLQLAKDGITVNNVAPGVIYTDRNVEALSDPEYAKKVTDSIPVGFYGEPEDCAGMVSLLCSEDGRYITGQNIFVDGGKSL